MTAGKVWLVGAGPGDPGLITVRGAELLSQADAVLYDALSHPALLHLCRAEAEVRDVGKLGGRHNPDQSWITEQLVQLARSGKRVVRLKGGDSFLFARGAEEAEALADAGVPFEVVPGLSSPVGTSAYAGIPLTHRELSSSVTFITGTDKNGAPRSEESWRKLATATDTICILMGMRSVAEIAQAIVDGGRSTATPVAVIEWGARPRQRVLVSSLGAVAADVAEQGLTNPAVIVVGEVVTLRSKLNWFEDLPLFGRRVLIPRPAHQAQETEKAVRALGAEPVLFPLIEIQPTSDSAALSAALGSLARYQWVVFTSANGVWRFFDELAAAGRDSRALGNCRVAVIGPKTAVALRRFGIRPDLVARQYVAESLVEELLAAGCTGPVLVPRAKIARELLVDALGERGIAVDVVPVYETKAVGAERRSELVKTLTSGAVDAVLFTSSSTVESMVSALGSELSALRGVTVASIGPVTTATAEGLGVTVDVTAESYTVAGLLDALARRG